MIRISVNRDALINKIDIFVDIDRIGRGINRTISISNTIKMIANRKNRMEKGIRALWLGSNPHSNGEDFSRDVVDRIETIQAIKKTIDGRMIATDEEIKIKVIY